MWRWSNPIFFFKLKVFILKIIFIHFEMCLICHMMMINASLNLSRSLSIRNEEISWHFLLLSFWRLVFKYNLHPIYFFWCSLLQVNSILRHVAELRGFKSNEKLEDLYEKTAWFFDAKYGKAGASYEAFRLAVQWVTFMHSNILKSEVTPGCIELINNSLGTGH